MVADTDLETLTRKQLLDVAKARQVALPKGNLSKNKLIDLLRKDAETKGRPPAAPQVHG